MRAPTRSHGFDKPSDLEDELAQLDEERADPELNHETVGEPVTRGTSTAANRAIQQQIDDLRRDLDAFRRDVDALGKARNGQKRSEGEVSSWLPLIRSVAVTSLAGRIFASSPMVALLVAAVPFALGLSAGSK